LPDDRGAGDRVIDYDVVIVGGGPAGSTCARFLTRGGARVAVIDRADFPRVKLCGGWLSTPIWEALGITPRDYSGGLWEWNACHVRFGGVDRTIACRGWFIRRFELDDFLLRQCGAELRLGVTVQEIRRADVDAEPESQEGGAGHRDHPTGGPWSVAGVRARHLVGAAGTHCPVARLLAPPRPMGPVGVQEHEFRADAGAIARSRVGGDGEPELLLHDDLSGYSWNVPKTDWINVGSGTVDPTQVRAAWRRARARFCDAGHVPAESAHQLEPKAMKGHSYYLYDPAHLDGAARVDEGGNGGAYLIGDSLGLAQPLTAEGILPAVISGRLLAEAILAGDPASYPARLRAHPVLRDYQRIHGLREVAGALRRTGRSRSSAPAPARSDSASASPEPSPSPEQPDSRSPAPEPAGSSSPFVSATPSPAAALAARLGGRAVASGFAWMFSGASIPAPRLFDLALAAAARVARLRGADPDRSSGQPGHSKGSS
jgi:flavin-dependent dehydrogenase